MAKVIIKENWDGAGKIGEVIDDSRRIGKQDWTTVLWDGDEDPSWHKSAGLRPYTEKDFEEKVGWIVVSRETGEMSTLEFHRGPQDVNSSHRNIPVIITRRKFRNKGQIACPGCLSINIFPSDKRGWICLECNEQWEEPV